MNRQECGCHSNDNDKDRTAKDAKSAKGDSNGNNNDKDRTAKVAKGKSSNNRRKHHGKYGTQS